MKTIFISILLVCVSVYTEAQTNFVKNGDFERYDTCPYQDAQITFARFWQNTVVPDFVRGVGYYNACAIGNIYAGCPINGAFYQNPRSGNGMAGSTFYYDKTLPPLPPPSPFNNRLYIQGHLMKKLVSGKKYCVSFWVNLMEGSGYAHNKIGAYLDDGSINTTVDSAGEEILSVVPQLYTDSIIQDTMNWVKIEGSFTATGNESYITIGNFFPNAATDTVVTNYRFLYQQQSAYLVDDVSVVPIDAVAQAGVDRWVELGKQTQIGPVEDSTAMVMDCKWYYKSKLIDSGNVITVSASTIKYAVDTYVVVQNVCGKTTRDTMLLRTVGAGMGNVAPIENTFSICPNPSNGMLYISNTSLRGGGTTACPALAETNIKVYDLLGRVVFEQSLILNKAQIPLELNLARGTYILELSTEDAVQRERIVIE